MVRVNDTARAKPFTCDPFTYRVSTPNDSLDQGEMASIAIAMSPVEVPSGDSRIAVGPGPYLSREWQWI